MNYLKIIFIIIPLTGCVSQINNYPKKDMSMNNTINENIQLKRVNGLEGKSIGDIVHKYNREVKDLMLITEPLFSISYISLPVSKEQSLVMFFDKETLKLPRFRENYDLSAESLINDKPKELYLVNRNEVYKILRTKTIVVD